MELHIGQNIRRLRLERNLTQEEVAAHLGISFQSVSKWERGDGYPDITLLPALSHYFGTSVDELLGVSELEREAFYENLNREWTENNLAGKHAENVALMRRALKDFPNDALLLVQLSTSLEKLDGTDEEKREHLRRSIAVQEQILRGEDSEVRNATLFNICFAYMKNGQTEKAIEQAGKLPNLYKTRENALVCLLPDGEERTRIAVAALEPLKWAIDLHLRALNKPEISEQCISLLNSLSESLPII